MRLVGLKLALDRRSRNKIPLNELQAELAHRYGQQKLGMRVASRLPRGVSLTFRQWEMLLPAFKAHRYLLHQHVSFHKDRRR